MFAYILSCLYIKVVANINFILANPSFAPAYMEACERRGKQALSAVCPGHIKNKPSFAEATEG